MKCEKEDSSENIESHGNLETGHNDEYIGGLTTNKALFGEGKSQISALTKDCNAFHTELELKRLRFTRKMRK